ncbi:MAG: hypothetical protein K0S09_72 [Sphingobacteriaceae bacterium]|jgi:outer membrane protein assembly factor BamE (lipoprotein component of BamABCDE complex)|nr:hypothetical protein [Sphingobacteriaceae bacterium]
MKAPILLTLTAIYLAGCSQSPKKLGSVGNGMTKDEVVAAVGEPAKRNVVNQTEIWDYPDSSRTIVFRMDTVYTIITSAKARADSMGVWLDSTDQKVKDGFGKIGDGLENAADKVKDKLHKDSTEKH